MTRFYLYLSAGGLGMVALGYALAPHTAIGSLITLSFEEIDQVHILRGIMGLYLGMAGFWFMSANKPEYSRAAVTSVIFFMTGLALGRIFSMAVDGMPSPFLLGATFIELASAAWGAAILRSSDLT